MVSTPSATLVLFDFMTVGQQRRGVTLEDLKCPRHLADFIARAIWNYGYVFLVKSDAAHSISDNFDPRYDTADDEDAQRQNECERDHCNGRNPVHQLVAALKQFGDAMFGRSDAAGSAETDQILNFVSRFFVNLHGVDSFSLCEVGGKIQHTAAAQHKGFKVLLNGIQQWVVGIADQFGDAVRNGLRDTPVAVDRNKIELHGRRFNNAPVPLKQQFYIGGRRRKGDVTIADFRDDVLSPLHIKESSEGQHHDRAERQPTHAIEPRCNAAGQQLCGTI